MTFRALNVVNTLTFNFTMEKGRAHDMTRDLLTLRGIKDSYAEDCVVGLRDFFYTCLDRDDRLKNQVVCSLTDYSNAYRQTLHYFHAFDERHLPGIVEIDPVKQAHKLWRQSGISFSQVRGNNGHFFERRMRARGAPWLIFDHVIMEVSSVDDGDVYYVA
jgi:hypothetical protein